MRASAAARTSASARWPARRRSPWTSSTSSTRTCATPSRTASDTASDTAPQTNPPRVTGAGSSCSRDEDVCRPDESSGSVAAVDVAGVDLVADALELVGVPVGDDDVGRGHELVEVTDDARVEEVVLLEGRIVDDDLDALGLDP